MVNFVNTGYFEWENLQSAMMSIQNRIVREEFNDIDGDDDDYPVTTGRARLRYLCTLRDNDSVDVTLSKLMFFYIVLRKAADLQTPVYGIPVPDYQEQVTFRPQVRLYFVQDMDSVPDNESPVRAEISFRLMTETSGSLTESELRNLGNRIKSSFGAGGGYRWRKGHLKASYRDLENGYRFILTVYSESEAKEVIQKIVSIRNHSPDWRYLTISESKATFPSTTGSQVILGKSRKKPRKRPVAYVRFAFASCAIWGIPEDVVLYDRQGYKRNSLVR